MTRALSIALFLALFVQGDDLVLLKQFPVDDLEGVIDRDAVKLDQRITEDNKGAFRIEDRGTVQLYETGDIDVEQAVLLYRARVMTLNVKGSAYLEMWCRFPGQGEFFSRGLQYSLSGTHHWTTIEAPFYLRKGENPDNIRLNVVLDGGGKIWIDKIELLRGPLPDD
jgi:hypothetical protein